jgi:hypothetical protein
MDVRIVEEDMTFYRAQEGSTCSGYDLDVFGSDSVVGVAHECVDI